MLMKTLDWIKRLRRYNRARMRMVDVDFLWPSLVKRAPTVAQARCAFLEHAMSDSSWTKDMTNAEIANFVDVMEPPRLQKWKRDNR